MQRSLELDNFHLATFDESCDHGAKVIVIPFDSDTL